MDMTVVYWALLIAVALVAAGFAIVEYQAYMLRSDVKSVPGGLRFTSQYFTVEAARSEKLVKVTCKNGSHRNTPADGGSEQIRTGSMSVALPAAGMRIQVSQIGKRRAPGEPLIATGLSVIEFSAFNKFGPSTSSKGQKPNNVLELDGIPDSVAQALRHYAEGLFVWFDRLEADIAAEQAAREQQEAMNAAAQKAALEASIPSPAPTAPLNAAEREAKAKALLADWRKSAGFQGNKSEMKVDAAGGVEWLIDLNMDGRIILHSESLHFHGTLKGSVVTMLADELEVKVRDEFWQEGDRNLPTFRVLKGFSREALLNWRDLLIHAAEIFVHDPGRHAPPSGKN
jgi:hypothetical protein